MSAEVCTTIESEDEARAFASALLGALLEKRAPPPPAQMELTPAQVAAVEVFLRQNDATNLAQQRASIGFVHAALTQKFGLKMSRERFVAAVCKAFGRKSWAKKS